MWVTLPWAFVSAVAHDDPDLLWVRARAKADLEQLVDRCQIEEHQDRIPITSTPFRDYPYRIEVSRKTLGAVLAAFISDELIYTNFKSEVDRVAGPTRSGPLHDVWEVMHQVEDAGARPMRLPLPRQAARVKPRTR